MGTIHHISMTITTHDEKKLNKIRDKALKIMDKKTVSKIMGTGMNGYKSLVIVPSGSQMGWQEDVQQRESIQALKEWIDSKFTYDDGSSSIRYVIIEFGEHGLQASDGEGNELNSREVNRGKIQRSGAW